MQYSYSVPKMHPMQKDSLTIDGIKVVYNWRGKGRPVLFLHGWGGSKDSWQELWGEMNDGLLIAPDLPGFGESDQPDRPYDVTAYTRLLNKFIVQVCEKLKCGNKFDMVVHSFGGRIAIRYFSLFSQNAPRKVVLIAAAGIKHTPSLKMRIGKVLAKAGGFLKKLPGSRLLQKVLYRLMGSYDYLEASGVMKESFSMVIAEDLKPLIEQISAPTLIIWGSEDRYVPLEDAHYLAKHIGNSKLEILQGVGHRIHRDQPKQVANWINKFSNA